MQKEIQADVIIVGGGVGGCAAALAAAKMGKTVIMTEETLWLGGQLTSQAVPPDEHPWIEQFGCTRSYRQFRDGVRRYYRDHFPLSQKARQSAYLNPGNGGVSRLCHEPRAALAVIEQLLAPHVHSSRVIILREHKPVSAEVDGDRIRSATVEHVHTGERIVLCAPYFLDATELGDLLPLTGCEYVTGAESKRQTGEPHAVDGDPQPLDMQAITYCFAMDYLSGEDHTIDKPREYTFWRDYRANFWPNRQLHWNSPNPITLQSVDRTLFPEPGKPSLWTYRRIIDREQFAPGTFASDISLVNWPHNDYWLGPICEVPQKEIAKHVESAKQLSLSLLYWMQTEAPRHDGGIGYPGLRLRRDVVGTADGLAMYPYVRESRRIAAEFTVLEQHISPSALAEIEGERGVSSSWPVSGPLTAPAFTDSVGIGAYRIDLHPSTGGLNYIDIASLPFQIPLGALIPKRMDNLLAAAKNLGVTHITNGCYRLHPVEWNIGEAAGYLAAYCLTNDLKPAYVRNDRKQLTSFQALLISQGIELAWPAIKAL